MTSRFRIARRAGMQPDTNFQGASYQPVENASHTQRELSLSQEDAFILEDINAHRYDSVDGGRRNAHLDNTVVGSAPVLADSGTTSGTAIRSLDSERPNTSLKFKTPVVMSTERSNPGDSLDIHSIADGLGGFPEAAPSTNGCTFFTPFFLMKTVLLSFVALYVTLILALIALFVTSRTKSGLVSTTNELRYLWRFGPTAFIAVVIAFWGQVELRVKQAMPWDSLRKKRGPYNENVGLDYVDPWAGIALIKAIRLRHWPVAIVILGSFTLKVIMIASSGLFLLEAILTSMPSNEIMVTSAFRRDRAMNQFSSNHLGTWAGVSRLGLGYPLGTTDSVAYQTFNLTSIPGHLVNGGISHTNLNLSMSAKVDAFSLDLHCEVPLERALVRINSTGTIGNVSYRFLETPGKSAGGIGPTGVAPLILDHGSCSSQIQIPSTYEGPGTHALISRADTYWASCDSALSVEPLFDMDNFPRVNVRETRDHLLILVTDPVDNTTAVRVTAAFCTPFYAFGLAKVSMSYVQNGSVEIEAPKSGQFENITSIAMLENVARVVGQPGANNGFWLPNINDFKSTAHGGDTWFNYMNVSNSRPVMDYMDAKMTVSRAKDLFRGLGVQLLHSTLSQPTNTQSRGTVIGISQRLVVSDVSAGLIIGLLVIMVAVTIYLVFEAPRAVTLFDPSSIAGIAALLATSDSFLRYVQANPPISRMRRSKFSSNSGLFSWEKTETGFQVSCGGITDDAEEEDDSRQTRLVWWRPTAASTYSKLALLVLLMATIIVLEVLYRRSKRADGLAGLPSNTYIGYLRTYLPTVIMVLIGALIDSINFTMRILQPFHALQKGNVSARRSICDEQVSGLALTRMWASVMKGQFAMFICAIAVLLSPLLTIAVSGLYFDEIRPTANTGVTISVLETFNFEQSPLYFPRNLTDEQNIAMDAPAMMIANGLRAPQWTTRDLAFPRIAFGNNVDTTYDSISVRLRAIRGRSNCSFTTPVSLIKPHEMAVCSDDPNKVVQEECGLAGFVKNYTVIDVTALQLPPRCNVTRWRQHANAGGSGITAYFDSNTFPPALRDTPLILDVECSADFAVVGYNDSSSGVSSVKLAPCRPYFETVDADVTFSIPDYRITEVKTDEDSRKVMGHTIIKTPTLYPSLFISLNPYGDRATLSVESSLIAGPVQNMMVAGADPAVQVEDFLDERRHQHILDAMNAAWAIEAAQIGNNYLRTTLSQPQNVQGTLGNDSRRRLVQSQLSTRLTQGLLGLILALMVVLFVIRRDANHTVPWGPPTTIAVAAALIASSRMRKEIAEWNGAVHEITTLDGGLFGPDARFSLRWWDGKDGERWFGIDYEIQRD